ncbi:MAG: glycerophosphodiester phosphodiesterase [Actinobacteria bacterium]|nr:glycerophosphodiester phosphodiesterase [Actinomycetota bacterium]
MKIYAHRGFSYKYKEATLAAYQGAIDVGADGLECDVRLTKDNVPVCFHDRTTKRISGVNRRVAKLTLTQLREITDVLTLEELLDLARRTKREVLVETKHPVMSGSRVEKIVAGLGKSCKFTAMSFSLLAVLRFKRELDDVAYVVARRWRLLYLPTKKVAVDVELFVRSPWTRRRLERREVLLWTVNDEGLFAEAKKWKVSGLITDRPDLRAKI